jgi:hypothetical protein
VVARSSADVVAGTRDRPRCRDCPIRVALM